MEFTVHAVFGPFPAVEVAEVFVAGEVTPFHGEVASIVPGPAGEVAVHAEFEFSFPSREAALEWVRHELTMFFGRPALTWTGQVLRAEFSVSRAESGDFLFVPAS